MMPIKRRRILQQIKISEISGVDKPCNEHAVVTIMKRAQEPTMTSFAALEDRILILKDRADTLTKTVEDRAQPTPEPAAPIPDFDQVVAAIQTRDRCGGTTAMSKARREAPTAFATYIGNTALSPNANAMGKASATADFMREVDAVMIQKRCSRTQAMSEARRQNPKLFNAFQEV